MGEGDNETAGNTHCAGAHYSKGTGIIPFVGGGEVPKLTGQGNGSRTGCWSAAFHDMARGESWKGGGVGAGGGNRGNICFPVDEAATEELPLLLADLLTLALHSSSGRFVAHHASICLLSPMV